MYDPTFSRTRCGATAGTAFAGCTRSDEGYGRGGSSIDSRCGITTDSQVVTAGCKRSYGSLIFQESMVCHVGPISYEEHEGQPGYGSYEDTIVRVGDSSFRCGTTRFYGGPYTRDCEAMIWTADQTDPIHCRIVHDTAQTILASLKTCADDLQG
jgi:hypothetical protein